MPALIPTKIIGEIVWLGAVPIRADGLQSKARSSIQATFAGFDGECHAGLTRPSDSRVLSQYPRDTEIRNVRQFCIVSAEELNEIAANLGVAVVEPELLGASMVVRGIPDFTHIPPSSRLQNQNGVTLTVDMENLPCHLVTKVVNDEKGKTDTPFKLAAAGKRGVTAWVEREGLFTVGDTLTVHIPGQRPWAVIDAV